MYDISKSVFEREQFLTQLISSMKKSLKHVPEGRLRISPHGKTTQFYQITDGGSPAGKYLRKNQSDLIHALAQKQYDQSVLEAAEKEHHILSRLTHFYQTGQAAEELYVKESEPRKRIITPIEPTDEMYVKKWLSEPYQKLHTHEKPEGYISDKNEQMRSKSEVLIANSLTRYNIPYRYECAVKIGERYFYPDFTILNVKKRKIFYWEHLGLLDDLAYLEKNLNKLTTYEMNGIFPGDNLIITFETSRLPLNLRVVEKTIEHYFQ